jgi:hypothetical protein
VTSKFSAAFYIQEFDEVKGKLGLTGIVYVKWRDETVSWDPSESYINSLTYMNNPFWKPFFSIGNSYDGPNYIFKDDTISWSVLIRLFLRDI